MPYDEELADRLRELLAGEDALTERKMFGGIVFMLNGNMSVGVWSTGGLMVRVGEDGADDALAEPHTRTPEMRGRPMTGWILVEREGLKTKADLHKWVRRGTDFARSLPPKD
jgi:TfoX/Sxy family transcriptional regulator of competence genes